MKRIIALSLALVLLTSSFGFTMNTHFCGGVAVQSTLSLGHEHLDCGMNMQPTTCDLDDPNMLKISQNQCCANQHLLLQVEDEAKVQQPSPSLNPIFLIAFTETFIFSAEFTQQNVVRFTDYSPPIPDKDILLLYHTLLI